MLDLRELAEFRARQEKAREILEDAERAHRSLPAWRREAIERRAYDDELYDECLGLLTTASSQARERWAENVRANLAILEFVERLLAGDRPAAADAPQELRDIGRLGRRLLDALHEDDIRQLVFFLKQALELGQPGACLLQADRVPGKGRRALRFRAKALPGAIGDEAAARWGA